MAFPRCRSPWRTPSGSTPAASLLLSSCTGSESRAAPDIRRLAEAGQSQPATRSATVRLDASQSLVYGSIRTAEPPLGRAEHFAFAHLVEMMALARGIHGSHLHGPGLVLQVRREMHLQAAAVGPPDFQCRVARSAGVDHQYIALVQESREIVETCMCDFAAGSAGYHQAHTIAPQASTLGRLGSLQFMRQRKVEPRCELNGHDSLSPRHP